MRSTWVCAAALAVLLLVSGAGTEARGDNPRRTPIVEAVEKTRASIVSVLVEKNTNWGRKDSIGCGVLIDERGYLITNYHVIAKAAVIRIKLHDGTELEGKVFAEEPSQDLAIVHIEAKQKLKALALGPSSDVMVGETVIAIGHPFGYTNTVSTGIISATGREIKVSDRDTLRDILQVNASINPGNSGGPLLNILGELIGINVALREDAQGIGFAISSDTVKQVLCKHLGAAKVSGVSHGLACREKVASEGPGRQRVIVERVEEASPAASAGVKRGDAILCVAGRDVSNPFDLERSLWERKPGEKLDVRVLRDGKEITLALTLGKK